jgi:outer membrane protein assembly factor BamE (lipoprotein component of BamABCDE complex)
MQRARSICELARISLLWIWLLPATSGCAFSRGDLGVPLNDNGISAIKKGQTTQAQVVALLGAPDSIQEIGHKEVFHYYRYALKHGTVLVFSRVNIASDDLYVFFDQDNVVQQVLFGNQTQNLKFQFWPFGHTTGE